MAGHTLFLSWVQQHQSSLYFVVSFGLVVRACVMYADNVWYVTVGGGGVFALLMTKYVDCLHGSDWRQHADYYTTSTT